MGNRGKNSSKKDIFVNLQKVINSLPTEAEKKELEDNVTVVIDFFVDMKRRLAMMPAMEDYQAAQSTLKNLEELFTKSKDHRILSSMLGIGSQPKRGRKLQLTSEADIHDATEDLKQLETLSIDEIRIRLRDEDRYPMRKLQALIATMGIRGSSKMGRDGLADLIATKISNYRGYKMLRGEGEPDGQAG